MRDGLVVVDKPAGWTSHDVVAKLRSIYGQRRVGHAGTLDPDATGVLLVGLGRVTRLLRYLQEAGKSYRGRVVFGVATDTLDASGAVLERAEMHARARADRGRGARAFVGDIEQVPPMVSAIKVGGRRLYELAREGRRVERAATPVRIDELVVEEFEPGPYPEVDDPPRRAPAAPTCARSLPISAPRSAAARTSASCAGCGSAGSPSTIARRSRRSKPIPTRPSAGPDRRGARPRAGARSTRNGARAVAHGATFAAAAPLVGDDAGTRGPVRGGRRARRSCSRSTSGAGAA